MDIKFLGHASFLIKTKTARIVTDPFDPKMLGLKFPKVEADIVTVSHHHHDHDFTKQVSSEFSVFDWPGEFEKNGVRIFGYQSYHDKEQGAKRGQNILYKFEAEDLSVLHCGDWGLVPDQSMLDEIGDVDILMVPVGGFYTISADEAVEVVKKIEPSIVIPMHYGGPHLTNREIAEKLSPLSDFLKKMDAEEIKPIEKLSVKKEELAEEETRVIPLAITN